jgi:hypothetical protein
MADGVLNHQTLSVVKGVPGFNGDDLTGHYFIDDHFGPGLMGYKIYKYLTKNDLPLLI